MRNPLKRNPITAAESELANLAARRETLETRRANAAAALDAARSARRNALSNDPTMDLSALNRAVRDGEDELETLSGVLADLADEVANADRRLTDAKDDELRAASAKALEGVAIAVDNAAADLERGLSIVGKAYAALVAAIPETLHVVELDERIVPPERSTTISPPGVFQVEEYSRQALPNDLARAVLAEGLSRLCPMAFGYRRERGDWRFELRRAMHLAATRPSFSTPDLAAGGRSVPATEAAVHLISGRLRDRAKHIVAGDMSPNLEDAPIFRPQPAPPVIPEVEVYVVENVCFSINEREARRIHGRGWVAWMPEDAAAAAVAAGKALRTDTPEGAAAFQAQKDLRKQSPFGGSQMSGLGRQDCYDLGVIRKASDIGREAA